MDIDDRDVTIDHEGFCDTAQHTDPAVGCASPTVDTSGILTHVAGTSDSRHAFLELVRPGPIVLTAGACHHLAERFTHLSHLLHG